MYGDRDGVHSIKHLPQTYLRHSGYRRIVTMHN